MEFLKDFSKKIISEDDIKKDKDLIFLAQIPLEESKKELLSVDNLKSEALKAFKKLRINMQFLSVNNHEKKIILVTSPNSSEGKSFVSANMAVSYAEIGKKVIIIDADMNFGKQWRIFDIPNNLGLSNYLSNLDTNGEEIKESLNKYINETGIKKVNIITSGTIPPNSSELLKSPKLKDLFKDLSVFYDVIIIDGTPILSSTDSLSLTKLATSTIIVTSFKKTTIEDLEKTKKIIQDSKGKIAGVILNKVKIKLKEKNKKLQKSLKSKLSDFVNKIKNKFKSKKYDSKTKLLIEAKKLESQLDAESSKLEKDLNIKDSKLKETLNIESSKLKKDLNDEILKLKQELNSETKKVQEELNFESKKIKEELNSESKKVKEKLDSKTKKAEKKLTDEIIKENKKSNNKKTKKDELSFEEKYKNVVIENKTTDNKGIFNREDVDINKILDKIKADKPLENVKINISDGGVEIEYDEDLEENSTESHKENIFTRLYKNIFGNKNTKSVEKDENSNKEEKILENSNLQNINIEDNNLQNNNLQNNNLQNNNLQNNNLQNNNLENINIENSIGNNDFREYESIDEENSSTYDEMNENFVLTVVDAKNANCRVFSKHYFTEKNVRGLDKEEGIIIDFYSQKAINEIYENIIIEYNLTKDQISRIDPLIYSTLRSYDDSIRIERRIKSEMSKIYVLCMSKEYNKLPRETEKEFEIRCKRLRINDLSKLNLEIEYKLDDIWSTNKMKLSDKIAMNKYAKLFEVDNKLKNEYEIKRSKNNNDLYEDILKVAENTLNSNNYNLQQTSTIENVSNESDDTIVIELDEKIPEEKVDKKNKTSKRRMRRELTDKEEKRRENLFKKNKKIRLKQEKRRLKEEQMRRKSLERKKQREASRIEEELLEDNLYPKTKSNKDLFL